MNEPAYILFWVGTMPLMLRFGFGSRVTDGNASRPRLNVL